MAGPRPVSKDQASPEIKEVYQNLEQNFGKVPGFFGTMAHAPQALKNFIPFYGAVMGPGKLEAKYKELAYLKTSQVNGCAYCMRAHTASSKGAGVTPEQIGALTFYPFSDVFDEKEMAVVRYADHVTRGAASVSDGVMEELRKHFSEEEIVELTLVVSVANFTNRFNEAFHIEPDLG